MTPLEQKQIEKETIDLYANRLLHAFTKDRIVELLTSLAGELSAFESEIASLENQSDPEQITDVEIMRKANELVYPLAGDCTKSDAERKCIEMAKWMQSRLSLQAEPKLRDELIRFASRNDKYDLTNIRNTEVSSYLEMLKKNHERTVDEYLNSKQG